MKVSDLEKLAQDLQKRPIPGKRVIVWIGDKEELYKHIPKEMTEELIVSRLPVDQADLQNEKKLQKALRSKLNQALQNYHSQISGQRILIVSDAELLARYQISLQPFYDYFVGDRTMTILIVPDAKISISDNLWGYFKLEEDSVLSYLMSLLTQNDSIVNSINNKGGRRSYD
jgi:DNA-binding protein Fis